MQDTWRGFQQQYPSQLAAAQAAAAAGGGLFGASFAGPPSAAQHQQQQQQQQARQGVQQLERGAAADLDEQYWQQLLLDRWVKGATVPCIAEA
jgi:hypothetical protein